MKSKTIKTVLVTLLVVMVIGLLTESDEDAKEKERTNKYTVEASSPTPEAASSPIIMNVPNHFDFDKGHLSKDDILNGIMHTVDKDWEYSDFDYDAETDTVSIHIGTPSITSTLDKIPYDEKLNEEWFCETEVALKDLNASMVDLFRKNNYQSHVVLYFHSGYQNENIVLTVVDGKVTYDYYFNVDICGDEETY